MTQEFRLREFEVPVAKDGKSCIIELRDSNKRLVNKSLGKGYDVPGGLTWEHICKNILCDRTNPGTLARVARGQLKSTNGREVTILD